MASSECKMKKVLSDKWMIAVFPIITLTVFFLGIIGLFAINSLVLPLLFD